MTAISLIALCAVIGLAFDVGYLFDDKRRAQTAADAAALAGARQVKRATGDVVGAAKAGATINGFTDGADGTEVAINIPPTSGYYAGNPSFLEAIVTRSRPTLFMSIVNFRSGTVRARAVAGVSNSPNCIYALDRNANPGFNLSGGATLNAGCGIMVDSNASKALDSGGGSTLSGTSISVTGNANGCCYSPAPQTNVPPEPDPLADRAAPTFSQHCDYNNTKVNGRVTSLGPGVYCNGIQVQNGSSVTFLPGTYILDGGGFLVSGNSTINGTGVTFYNTSTSGKKSDFGPINISGGTVGSLSAPTSGPMEGMLFFQDRTITSNVTNNISGNAGLTLEGALYFPTTDLNFSGGTTGTANYTIIVAATINITGQTVLNANYGGLSDGDPIKTVSLGE